MALYRFLFAPVLLAVAVVTAPGPSAPQAPPPAPEQHVAAPVPSAALSTVPAALERAAARRPIRAR